MINHFNLGWYPKINNKKKAIKIANSIRLLKKRELMEFFPGATIHKEKFLGLTRSFIVYMS